MKLTIFLAAFTSTVVAVQHPEVDLGYDVYRGIANDTTRLNIFKGFVKESDLRRLLSSPAFDLQLHLLAHCVGRHLNGLRSTVRLSSQRPASAPHALRASDLAWRSERHLRLSMRTAFSSMCTRRRMPVIYLSLSGFMVVATGSVMVARI